MPGFAWVLLALGAAVAAALCAPVTLLAAHRTGQPPRLELRWLFLRLDLQKLAQRQAAGPPKKSPKRRAKPRPAAPPPPQTAGELLAQVGLVRQLLGAARPGVALLWRHLRVSRLRLWVRVAETDAALTAIRYGQLNGAVHSLYTLAAGLVRLSPPDIRIRADFLSGSFWMELEARLRLRPVWALAAAGRAAVGLAAWAIRQRQAPPGPPAKSTENQAG